jgi:methionyl aminopeptidase
MPRANGITIKSMRELDYMREAGRVASLTKAVLKDAIRPGVTSRELDALAEREIRSLGAVPSFKGLYGFPATICTSFNEEIVHGIPSKRRLEEGDIIGIDLGAIVGGFHSDTAFTVGVGQIGEDSRRLIEATEESLRLAVDQTREGRRVGDIGAAVETYAEGLGYGVVRQYVGHGIGRALHEDPSVPNYGTPGRGAQLRVGMTVAIEPMLNLGTWDTRVLDDGWTVVTADGSRSAHFEDTVAVTENGPEVLTA